MSRPKVSKNKVKKPTAKMISVNQIVLFGDSIIEVVSNSYGITVERFFSRLDPDSLLETREGTASFYLDIEEAKLLIKALKKAVS